MPIIAFAFFVKHSLVNKLQLNREYGRCKKKSIFLWSKPLGDAANTVVDKSFQEIEWFLNSSFVKTLDYVGL